MSGRGIALAVGVVLAILFVLIVQQLGSSRRLLVETERERRHGAFQDAAEALSGRLEDAHRAVRGVADAEALAALLDDADDLAAHRALDARLRELGEPTAVRRIAVLEPERGRPLLAFSAERDRAPRPTLGAAPPRPAVAGARARAGRVAWAIAPRPDDRRVVQVALLVRRGPGAIVLVEVDAARELAGCAQAARGGEWALVRSGADEDGAAAGALVAPPGAEPSAPLIAAGLDQRANTTTAQGEAFSSAMELPLAGWRLVARVPFAEAARVSRELFVTLGLAGLLVVIVLTIGVPSVRLAAKEEEREETLAQRQRHEAFLTAVFDAMPDVLIVVEPDLTVRQANRVARERLGDVEGRPYVEAVAARSEAPAAEVEGLREVVAAGRPRRFEAAGPAGEGVWEVAQSPFFARDNTVGGVVEYAADVSRTRLLQAQLVQKEKLSTLGEMAAGIAHEINNPVGVVSMFAELLAEEIREAEGAEAPALEKVQTIQESASHVGEIVTNLLRFARQSEGRKAPLDPETAIERALTIFRHQKAHRAIEVLRRDAAGDAQVLGDEAQLAQVLLNLAVNASHAMGGEGRLEVAVTRSGPEADPPPGRAFGEPPRGERVRIAVADTGAGIEPATLSRMFEPFFTTKDVGEGTGLGLSVSFGIVRDHGGCIWVDSEVGVGTTFTLELPAADGAHGTEPAEAS